MEYRRLGSSDLEVSVVGLGTNNFGRRLDDLNEATRIVHAAIDGGVNLLDTADDYGGNHRSEEFIGHAIKGRRGQVLIATKVGNAVGDRPENDGIAGSYILRAIDASLRALGTDDVDLYQVHHPDEHTPLDETLRALEETVRAGKVRYVGCSNFSGAQIAEAAKIAVQAGVHSFVSEQPHYNMLVRGVEREVLPACAEHGLGVLPYYPLAGGFLTGKYRRDEAVPEGTRFDIAENQRLRWFSDENFDLLEALEEFSRVRGHAIVDLAFAWLLANPLVGSVIAGASRAEQVTANVAAGQWTLTADEKAELDGLLAASPSTYG